MQVLLFRQQQESSISGEDILRFVEQSCASEAEMPMYGHLIVLYIGSDSRPFWGVK